MKHFSSPAFWQHYRKLPENIRELADKNFKLLKQDSNHPSLHLKKVSQFWSVRVGRKYRALAVQVEEGLIWFWIGTHTEYDKLVRS
jgi:mRNA-degrading endonuclease RelE of RelBE toxin-antitoxin system